MINTILLIAAVSCGFSVTVLCGVSPATLMLSYADATECWDFLFPLSFCDLCWNGIKWVFPLKLKLLRVGIFFCIISNILTFPGL